MNTSGLRIALLTHSVNPRGGVVHTLELAAALHRRGCNVTVFAPAAAGETMFRASPCRVVLAHVAASPRNLVEMVQGRIDALKQALLDHDAGHFDVLHAQDSISGNALAELKEADAIPGFVRTVHHLDHFDQPQLAHWQTRAWRDADTLLCVSESWTHAMRSEHGVDAQTVPNGVDTARYCATDAGSTDAMTGNDFALRARLGIRSDAPVLLAVGGIEARKNTLRLLEAFALLRAQRPNAQLVIGGGASLLDHDRYTRDFIARAAELDLAIGPRQPVVLTGPLDDADMPGLFRLADVVAMVSLREGFGLVVLEALASGKPVVVSQIEPFTGYLDARTCCWADPEEPASIEQALQRALVARGGLDFGNAVPALLRRFSWEASATRHLDLYDQHLARVQRADRTFADGVHVMPVMHFSVRWPDGSETDCYSPSTVVSEFFTPGERYGLADFVERSREALQIGSERVREKYGFACSAAMDQLARIELEAQRFADAPDAAVTVLALR